MHFLPNDSHNTLHRSVTLQKLKLFRLHSALSHTVLGTHRKQHTFSWSILVRISYKYLRSWPWQTSNRCCLTHDMPCAFRIDTNYHGHFITPPHCAVYPLMNFKVEIDISKKNQICTPLEQLSRSHNHCFPYIQSLSRLSPPGNNTSSGRQYNPCGYYLYQSKIYKNLCIKIAHLIGMHSIQHHQIQPLWRMCCILWMNLIDTLLHCPVILHSLPSNVYITVTHPMY